MNIGIFSDTYSPQINGVATSISTLVNGLEKRGHRVYIFTPSDPKAPREEQPNIFRIPSMPFLFARQYRAGILCPPHLLRKIKALELDVIHTQTEFSLGFLGKMIATAYAIPLIHTYHTMYEDYVHYIAGGYLISPEMAREFSKLFCNVTSGVIAPSLKTEDLLLQYGVTKPISIIPTGIDTSYFAKENYSDEDTLALRHSLGLQADTPVVLSLGRIAKEKSIDVLIGALPLLQQMLPAVKMVIVGEGPEEGNLRAYAKELGVENCIIFTGSKPWAEIGKYYQLGNVFSSASVSETQGLTFAEAMAAGIPVVAKKDPSIETIITHNETGLLFDTPEELPRLLYDVLTDESLHTRLSQAGMKEMKNLSIDNFVSSVESIYLDVCRQKNTLVPARPQSVGVRAAKGIAKIPRKLVDRSLRHSRQIVDLLPRIVKRK